MAFDGSYPAPPGNKHFSILDLNGPASYATMNFGTPPTGGQVVTAQQFGLTAIEAVWEMSSNDAQYDVVTTISPQTQNRPGTSVIVAWYSAAARTQVASATNLSSKWVRLVALGY